MWNIYGNVDFFGYVVLEIYKFLIKLWKSKIEYKNKDKNNE